MNLFAMIIGYGFMILVTLCIFGRLTEIVCNYIFKRIDQAQIFGEWLIHRNRTKNKNL